MALTSGTRLGRHDIVAPIGAGGMGEVYRATDSNLKRASNRDGANGIYVKNTGGATPEELVLKSEFPLFPADWSSDGKYIVYTEENPKTKTDIWVLPVSGERKPVPAVQTPFADSSGQLSPDGRWMSVEIKAQKPPSQFEVGIPQLAVRTRTAGSFGVTPDGQRFLVNGREADSAESSTLTVILNWAAALGAKK